MVRSKYDLIMEAAALIDNGQEFFCCFALGQVEGRYIFWKHDGLAREFAEFYDLIDAHCNHSNPFEELEYKLGLRDDKALGCDRSLKDTRVLALILFAEAMYA